MIYFKLYFNFIPFKDYVNSHSYTCIYIHVDNSGIHICNKLKSGQESNKYICKNAVDCSFEIGHGGHNINPLINSKFS